MPRSFPRRLCFACTRNSPSNPSPCSMASRLQTVCSLNRLRAQRRGPGNDAPRSGKHSRPAAACSVRFETEAAARAVLLECAAQLFSAHRSCKPRKQPPPAFSTLPAPSGSSARRTRSPAPARGSRAAGFRASIAVSANFHAARMKAATTRGIAVIPAGQEADCSGQTPARRAASRLGRRRNIRHLGHSHARRTGRAA